MKGISKKKSSRKAAQKSGQPGRSPADAGGPASRLPLGLLGAIGGVVVAVVVAVWAVAPQGLDLLGLDSTDSDDGVLKAVIVDQLDMTAPNPEFVSSVTTLLEGKGYAVDYAGAEDVTVDYYRGLPSRDYELVILRTHSTVEVSRGDDAVGEVSLFTNEPYSDDGYYDEQLKGRIGFAQYTDDGDKYFGITSGFIRDSMDGDLDGAVVVMMGCQGIENAEAAEAFADKGARTFIGWDGLVSADHTDEATELLLQYMVGESATPREAAAQAMASIGPDPDFGSRLAVSP